MKKIIAIIAVIVSLTMMLVLPACSKESPVVTDPGTSDTSPETVVTKPVSKEKVKVHVLLNNTKDFQALMKSGYESWSAENSDVVDMTILDAEYDVNKQVSQVEMAISSGADAIILTPVDSTTADAMTDMCKEADVPLICAQTPADSGYDVWVGSDHTISGQLQGEWIAKTLNGKGNVAIIYGMLGNDATNKRWDGAKSVLEQYEGINIVAEATGKWERNEGMKLMENWLQSDIGPTLNAVIGGNDEMAIGALLAAQEAGRDDIIFAGVDATSDALDWVGSDEMQYATVLQDAVNIANTACEWAIKLAQGEEVEYETYVDVPYVMITKENLSDYK